MKIFRTSEPHSGFGYRIYIPANAPMVNCNNALLNTLSAFGGCTSSNPDEYHMWEFACEGNDRDAWQYEAAKKMLLECGFREVAQLPEKDESYRNRLLKVIPEGAVYTAEDIGNQSGDFLDAIGDRYNCPRRST